MQRTGKDGHRGSARASRSTSVEIWQASAPIPHEERTAMDATEGLIKLLAILEAKKSRGWIAHNEFDYFAQCPTCGSWYDFRNPQNLSKHTHSVTASIVVQSSREYVSGTTLEFECQNLPRSGANAATKAPAPLPNATDRGAKLCQQPNGVAGEGHVRGK